MIPKHLNIAGFLSYNKEATIDFRDLDLACIIGANGAGKSSILDAITWALFGKARKNDDSIINLQSKQARVIFVFEYEGYIYKVIRTKHRDHPESVEVFMETPDNPKESQISLSERTLRATNEKIERIFGIDYNTFINVSFFLQGKADQFTKQTPGNRKAILSQILGLDMWEEYRSTTAEARRKLEREMERVEGQVTEISEGMEDEDELKAEIGRLKNMQHAFKDVALKYQTELEEAKTAHSSLFAQRRFLKDKKKVIDKMNSALSSTQKRLTTKLDDKEKGQEIIDRKDVIESQHQGWLDATKKVQELEPVYKEFIGIEDSKMLEIEDTAAAMIEIEQEIAAYNKVLEETDDKILNDSKIILLDQQIRIHQELLDDEICPTCGADVNAAEFEEDIEKLITERDSYAKELMEGLIKETTKRIVKLEEEKKMYIAATKKRAAKFTARLKELAFDEDEYDELKKQSTFMELIQEQYTLLVTMEAKMASVDDEIVELEKQITDLEDQVMEDTKWFESEVDKCDNIEDDLPELEGMEDDLAEAKAEENKYSQELGGAKEKLKALQASRERLSELRASRADMATTIALHKRLEGAFGKNGIPALLIEQALPQIEDKANELLHKLSGGTMSVHFLTQREYKDETRTDKKETLDIQIQDGSGIRDYEMYSGGESFRINFAIRLALSYVLSQRAGAKIQLLVIDEGFGSQDVVGKDRLVEAITAIKEDFETILVITHVDELKEIFPNQLFVEKKLEGSQISVI
jgi:exonuclease SbcC